MNRPPSRPDGRSAFEGGRNLTPRPCSAEPQDIGFDGSDRHRRAKIRQSSILRLGCDEALKDFPFLEKALRIWRQRHQERQFRGVAFPGGPGSAQSARAASQLQ